MLRLRKYSGAIFRKGFMAPSASERALGARPLPSSFGEPGSLPQGSTDVGEAAQQGGSRGQTFLPAGLEDLLPSAGDVAFMSSARRPCTR